VGHRVDGGGGRLGLCFCAFLFSDVFVFLRFSIVFVFLDFLYVFGVFVFPF
jgi:hypothetical protein